MKKRIIILMALFMFLMITQPILSPPLGENIRVDRSSYCIGDTIQVTFVMPANGNVIIWDHTTSGETKKIFEQSQKCGENFYMSITGVIDGPPGIETLEYEAYIGSCEGEGFGLSWVNESVSFTVKNCDPCRNINCEPRCYGCDYWAMECDDGECVKDYIIESDSCKCGSECCQEEEKEEKEEKRELKTIKVTVVAYDQFNQPVEGAEIFVEGEKIKKFWIFGLKTQKNGTATFILEVNKFEKAFEESGHISVKLEKEDYKYDKCWYYLEPTKEIIRIEFSGEKCIIKPFTLKIAIRSCGLFFVEYRGTRILDKKECSKRIFQDFWHDNWYTVTIYPINDEITLFINGWCGGERWFSESKYIPLLIDPSRKGIKVLYGVYSPDPCDATVEWELVKLEREPI
jgi:hypothetical protein